MKHCLVQPKQLLQGGSMVTNWLLEAGNDFVSPWEEYHRVLNDAEVARAEFLRNGFLTARKLLKDRICYQARKCHLRLCPLCC